MIVLRKQAKSDIVIGDPLLGTFDGLNQIFYTDNTYKSSGIMITYNGQVLYKDNDFTESGPSEITLTYLQPTNPKSLKATYIRG